MRMIKVSATDSTNSFLRKRMAEFPFENICVVTEEQTFGRGQMGTKWQSGKGENLTFSVLIRKLQLPAQKQFKLSALISLSLLEALRGLEIEDLSVKWPNDILAGNKKLAGILIENVLKGDKINASIIGIGLNVNQEFFFNLPKATSLKILSGKFYDLDSILDLILLDIESNIEKVHKLSEDEIFEKYHKILFGIHQENIFELSDGSKFIGKIQGVEANGKLVILNENNKERSFQLKEVKMIY